MPCGKRWQNPHPSPRDSFAAGHLLLLLLLLLLRAPTTSLLTTTPDEATTLIARAPDDMRRSEVVQHAELVRKGRIPGLLLDLDQGSMTVYKNDKWLGAMATGLSEYCWVVMPGRQGDCARIEATEVPASPTQSS